MSTLALRKTASQTRSVMDYVEASYGIDKSAMEKDDKKKMSVGKKVGLGVAAAGLAAAPLASSRVRDYLKGVGAAQRSGALGQFYQHQRASRAAGKIGK
jgi:hypothetical protein